MCKTCGCKDAESFEAHDPSHIYPFEELTHSHSHSSETFKSSKNNTNTMAAESKFDKLSDKIAKQYRKKGMSAKEAKEIGNKTAYTIGRKKYGKAGMAKKARAGMRAESFEADDDYVIVDRGNYKVRVHKKNLDRFNRSTMHKIHSDKNKEGLMYDEETSRWIPLEAESFEAEYNLIGRRKPRKLSLKVSDLKEALENANDDADVFVGDITPVREEMIGEPIVSAPRGVWTNGEEVYIVGATDWIYTEQIDELTWNRVNRAKDAESFGAEEWDFGNDREALRKSDENSDFNSAWRMVFRTKRRGWPSWGQKFYDKYKWTLDDSTWNPYVKGGDLEDEEEPKGFREAESFEAEGNPNKTTTSINPKFFVGKGDGDDLRGKGKFMKYNDALAKAQEVAEKEGKSRVVNNRGFALWTHDGQGLFQKGKSTAQAKKYYRAEEYSIGSGFRLGFGLGLGMLALSTVTTIAAVAASTIDERQVEK